ncbi:hypothetical protein ACU8OQ_23475 [Rhizobium leguminosarum]|uniref:hypothetical protein n=1 Tax=unclassified Rhizobium TaxID=2613769 RepID=UPI003F1E905E
MAWISRKLPTTAYRQGLSRARGKNERELSEIADLVRFTRSLIAQGLVDQFALLVAPVALGKGLPLFSGLAAPMPLKLVGAKAFPGRGGADLSALRSSQRTVIRISVLEENAFVCRRNDPELTGCGGRDEGARHHDRELTLALSLGLSAPNAGACLMSRRL